MDKKIYDVEELEDFSYEQLIKCLEDSWDITNGRFEVWGEIKPLHNNYSFLTNARTLVSSKLLAYPLKTELLPADFFIAPDDASQVGDREETRLIYHGVAPFILLQLIGLLVVFLWPAFATWLPSIAYAR